MKAKAIVLLSGGLDSTVNLYEAHQKFDVVQVLTIDYGQRALKKELEAAKYFSDQLGLKWQALDFKWLSQVSNSALTTTADIPQGKTVDIESHATSVETAKAVWVPNRNGLFLNIAAVYADVLEAEYIIPGFNKEEAATFPDNSKDFMVAMTHSLSFSTRNQAQVYCFTVDMDKTEIVKRAKELKVPIEKLWPCYHNFDQMCGQCESCLRFERALKNA